MCVSLNKTHFDSNDDFVILTNCIGQLHFDATENDYCCCSQNRLKPLRKKKKLNSKKSHPYLYVVNIFSSQKKRHITIVNHK